MPTTSSGLVYPSATDNVDVPGDIQALATSTQTVIDALKALQPKVKFKAANESRASTATLANDADLFIDLAVGLWRVELVAPFNAASVTPNIRTAWLFTGSASVAGRNTLGPATATTDITAATIRTTGHALTTAVLFGADGSGAFGTVREDLLMQVTVAGTLTFQWAQGALSVNATTLGNASRIIATPLAAG